MNDEVYYDFVPKYVLDKNFYLDEDELSELDSLANLLLYPDDNFDELLKIWNNNLKFRILSGGLN